MGLDVLFPKEFIERALASPDFKKKLLQKVIPMKIITDHLTIHL